VDECHQNCGCRFGSNSLEASFGNPFEKKKEKGVEEEAVTRHRSSYAATNPWMEGKANERTQQMDRKGRQKSPRSKRTLSVPEEEEEE